MVSDPKTAAVMEEDDFDKYEIDEEFKRIFWHGQHGPTANGLGNDDQELRYWLKALLEDDELNRYKDVAFIVRDRGQERAVRAHRLILMTRSRKFAEILDEEPDSSRPIKISDVDPSVFETIVHYVYTGQIEAPTRVLQTVDLMHAAAKYDIAPLHNVIRVFLEKRLPKLRIKHFIMITQRVLDLNLAELDHTCFLLVEGRTDQVVQDPMFLRVSSRFIERLLELDNFSGITEAAVFARVLEWATLRSGGSILPPASGAAERLAMMEGNNSNFDEVGFHLTRPDVRNVLEPFIRSFRLTSVPKDDLACLVKNSGVFTEHEQLVVSYYLLDQTKNLEDFTMKPRGTKLGSKRTDHVKSGQNSPQKPPPKPAHTKVIYPEIQRRPDTIAIGSSPRVLESVPDHEHTHSGANHNGHTHAIHNESKPANPPVHAIHDESKTASLPILSLPPPPPEIVIKSESVVEMKINHNGHQTHESPPKYRKRSLNKPEIQPQTAVHIPNPDYSLQIISKAPPPPPTTPKLLDKIRQQFSSDKVKTEGKNGKPSKIKKSSLKKTPSGRTVDVETTEVKGINSSSSSSSSDSSAHNSPTVVSRHSINVDRDTKDDALISAIKKTKPDVAKRPKSMIDVELEVDQQSTKDSSASGSVGKKGGIRSGLSGLMARTKKWSPDNTRNVKDGKESGKPAPPPRVKSVSDLSKREVVAEI